MKNRSNKLLFAVLLGLPSFQLQAQTAVPGDLILYLHKRGEANTVYVNLGNAANLYRGPETGPSAALQNLNIININTTLVSAFGETWASDAGIYAGAAGVFSDEPDEVVTDGDQSRTLYASRARTAIGTLGTPNSTLWNLTSVGNPSGAATSMAGLTTNFATRLGTARQGIVLAAQSSIDDTNPINTNGTQAAAFTGAFSGGVMHRGNASAFGTFGPAGSVEFALDLNRIVPDATVDPGEIAGTRLVGSYEGTVTIATDGTVAFITQGTASAYDSWIAGFPLLVTANNKLPGTDFDNDGFTNLQEFVLNGNPGVSSQAITPTFDASGANFVFEFTRRDDSKTEAPTTFQYGSDLVGWTNVSIPAATGSSGAATVTITPGNSVTDGISISLPKTEAVGGKLFGRIRIVK